VPRGFTLRAHFPQRGSCPLGIADRADPTGAELGGQGLRSAACSSYVEPDRVLCVDQPEFGIEQADQAGFAFDLGLDRLAAQQRHDDPDIFLHVGELDGAEPHRTPSGKPGADPEIDASRRQLVERGKGVGRHRRDSVRRDQDTGAQPDARRLDRRRCHRHKRVGAQHLGVVEPSAAEPQLLGTPHDPPRIGVGWDGDGEFHSHSILLRGHSRESTHS
jgi:hypothetical protein